MNDSKEKLTQFLMEMSVLHPLRGENALKEMALIFFSIGNQAEKDSLTEDDVTRLVHEARIVNN